VEHCRHRGTLVLFGDVMQSNIGMLGLCRELGFRYDTMTGATVRVSLSLNAPTPARLSLESATS
jgi:hypothetical protein